MAGGSNHRGLHASAKLVVSVSSHDTAAEQAVLAASSSAKSFIIRRLCVDRIRFCGFDRLRHTLQSSSLREALQMQSPVQGACDERRGGGFVMLSKLLLLSSLLVACSPTETAAARALLWGFEKKQPPAGPVIVVLPPPSGGGCTGEG
jgi:hypothetical protein